jgi:hypothetical protein
MKKSTIFFIFGGLFTILGALGGFAGEQMMFVENSNKMLLDMKNEIMNDEDEEDEEE